MISSHESVCNYYNTSTQKLFQQAHILNEILSFIFKYLTRPDTSDSGVDTGEETTGGGGGSGSTNGGESSRAEKVCISRSMPNYLYEKDFTDLNVNVLNLILIYSLLIACLKAQYKTFQTMQKTNTEICLADAYQKLNRIFQKNPSKSSKSQCTSIVTFNGFGLKGNPLRIRLFACIEFQVHFYE